MSVEKVRAKAGRKMGRPELDTKELEARKLLILETAARLFARQGYLNTTMDALADAVQLNKATLYNYYPSKSDVLFSVCERLFRNVTPLVELPRFEIPAALALEEILYGLIKLDDTDRDTMRTYFQESHFYESHFDPEQFRMVRTWERATMRAIYDIFQRGIYTGEFVRCDVKYVGRLVIGMALAPYRWRGEHPDVERVMQSIRLILSSGIKAPNAQPTPTGAATAIETDSAPSTPHSD